MGEENKNANLGMNIAAHMGDIENKRNTLTADTANKSAIQKLAAEKAIQCLTPPICYMQLLY